jgi:hypothetical protein
MRPVVWPALGALLVIIALALVVVLPKPDVPVPQARVAYEEQVTDLPGTTVAVNAGQEADIPIEVRVANLTRLVVTLRVQDDHPASEPDRFEVEVHGPDGIGRALASSATPGPQPNGKTPPGYTAGVRTIELAAAWRPMPREAFMDLQPGESLGMLAQRVALNQSRAPATPWTVHVKLVSAGGCPDAALDPPRAALCRPDLPMGTDPGNPIVLQGAKAYSYRALVAAA